MANTKRNAKTWALAGIFKRISLGEDLKLLRNEAIQLSKSVASGDISGAEEILVDEGYSHWFVQRLSAMFTLLALQKRSDGTSRDTLSDDRILRKIRVEHDLVRCYLTDLNTVAETIAGLCCLTDVSSEFRKLGHTVGHLSIMREHIDREEDVIFPYLSRPGWMHLCQSALNEHAKIIIDVDNLIALMTSFNEIGFEDFRGWLITIVRRLSPTILEHFSYEEELLYPISLIAIENGSVWERIKALCDEIGYCAAHNRLH